MKLGILFGAALTSLFTFAPGHLLAEEDPQKIFLDSLRSNSDFFELIDLEPEGSPTDFEVKLGESALVLPTKERVDGFRFKAPEGSAETDFIWYFNVPSNWAHWYLCPVTEDFTPSFRNWLDADKAYEKFDSPGASGRMRVLQKVDSGYFEPGEEYILWFREIESGEGQLTGRLHFSEPKDTWDHEAMEAALGLQPLPMEAQVTELKSRGGAILLDRDFFDKGYAEDRIDSVFFNIRQTKNLRGGFFITMQQTIPPCKTDPSFEAIMERHGAPDFVRTGAEENTLAEHQGREADEDPGLITYYYDYFGFQVDADDPKAIVSGVVTQADNFSDLRDGAEKSTFGQISMKNLTVFSTDGEEVGRMYYFLESGKEPLEITAPPVGVYKNGNEELEYLDGEKWVWSHYFDDGSVKRQIPLTGHQMNGSAKGFYEDGSPRFVVNYKDGVLDGKVVEYAEDGKIISEQVFEKGQRKESSD